MPRDYARSNYRARPRQDRRRAPRNNNLSRSTRKKKSTKPQAIVVSAALLSMGLLLGLFCAALLYLNYHKHQAPKVSATTAIHKVIKNTTAKIQNTPPKPQFDFYTILPKSQPQTVQTQPQPAPKTTQSTTTKKSYVLQIASVKHYKEADALKAKLSLQDFTVFISKNTKNHTTWYRVNIGPFTQFNKAEAIQDQLRTQHINSLLIRTTT